MAAQAESLEQLTAQSRLRQRTEIQRLPQGYALKNGKKLACFSDNDYLGLSFHPALIAASQQAITDYGVGAGASRLVTGNHPLYTELETKLAALKDTEDALVFGSGFLMNIGVVSGLIGKNDIIFADRLIHASLVDAMKLSGAKFQRFQHNDMMHLEGLLSRHSQPHTPHQRQIRAVVESHCAEIPQLQPSALCGMWERKDQKIYILTEGVFSMDGDVAPLAEMLALAQQYGATVIADDAHGFGLLEMPKHPNLIQTGTFSKACGSYGGYVAASKTVIETLVNNARSLIYTTGLPPAVVAANIAALEVIASQPNLGAKALSHAAYFCAELGLPVPESAIVPVIIGNAEAAMKASEMLEDAGFLVAAIRPPTVPEGSSRLRVTFSAVHKAETVAKLAHEIRRIKQCV